MHNIETLNKFLKDELAATETYQQALDKFKQDEDAGSEPLTPIHQDHKEAVASLQALINRLGGEPAEDSGVWGTWATLIQGGANLLGKQVALKVLHEGESKGTESYQKALQDSDLQTDIRSLIENKLLVDSQSHIRQLDQLLEVETD
jgi:uncharacterized protein (TIGR02284 family)